MKSLAVSDRYGWPRYVAHQAYYSLIGRDYEWELMPLGLDQKVGCVVWSPLGWARLTGKYRRGHPVPEGTRLQNQTARDVGPKTSDEHLYKVVDAIDEIAKETGKTVPQIALNWLLQRPTVATLVIGARNEEQLRQNLGARRLEPHRRSDPQARRGQRRPARLSLLAPKRLRPQSVPRRVESLGGPGYLLPGRAQRAGSGRGSLVPKFRTKTPRASFLGGTGSCPSERRRLRPK